MIEVANLLEDIDAIADGWTHDTDRTSSVIEAHNCDGCSEIKPDVDLWAMNADTGEEIWLCEACGDW